MLIWKNHKPIAQCVALWRKVALGQIARQEILLDEYAPYEPGQMDHVLGEFGRQFLEECRKVLGEEFTPVTTPQLLQILWHLRFGEMPSEKEIMDADAWERLATFAWLQNSLAKAIRSWDSLTVWEMEA